MKVKSPGSILLVLMRRVRSTSTASARCCPLCQTTGTAVRSGVFCSLELHGASFSRINTLIEEEVQRRLRNINLVSGSGSGSTDPSSSCDSVGVRTDPLL